MDAEMVKEIENIVKQQIAKHIKEAIPLLVDRQIRLPRPCQWNRSLENLAQRNAERAQALEGYLSRRLYQLEYSGFAGIRPEMVVEAKYAAPATKPGD